MDFINEIHKYNLNKDSYESLLSEIDKKLNGETDIDWTELCEKYNLPCHPDTIRKASASIFGGKFRSDYLKSQIYTNPDEFSKEKELNNKLSEIKKERIKLQTANIEKNRIDRAEARQEMFYEYVANAIETLPLPDFRPLDAKLNSGMEYVLTISDIHYGASYDSYNNSYSPEICKERFELLTNYVIDFVDKHNVSNLTVLELGDTLQGVLRMSDLKINDSSVVKSLVEISRIIANFLNTISEYTHVNYYHVNFANHTQTRVLGTKANEIADEDLEYVIKNYIHDLCKDNKRVCVHLNNHDEQYLILNINGFKTVVCHGHTIKNNKNALKDLSMLMGDNISYCIMGHFHGANAFTSYEGFTEDCETIICPSFCGSDPFSDSLFRGSKAACQILGFDEVFGHVETYKFILN